jgi:hypothetical protein
MTAFLIPGRRAIRIQSVYDGGMVRGPSPPTDRMNETATVLNRPMTWQEIQMALGQTFYHVPHAPLIGIPNAMIKRGRIVRDGDYYGSMEL